MIIHFLIFLFVKHIYAGYTFDSQVGIYKDQTILSSNHKDISNTTWKEFIISENITDLVKFIPAYIDHDNELDLIVLDFDSYLYWVSNIRGTSRILNQRIISDIKLFDFVISKAINFSPNENSFYILGLNAKRNKLYKFDSYEEVSNNSIIWKKTLFFDLEDENFLLRHIIKNSIITSLNLYSVSINRQYLYISTENYFDYSSYFVKITILDGKIDNIIPIQIKSSYKVKIVATFDMNGDGLIDILYTDELKNLYCLVNSDPEYFSVLISQINTVIRHEIPRIFLIDTDKDLYPDIITGNLEDNSFGILFNPGKEYWERLKLKKETRKWNYISIIDTYKEKLSDFKLKDFTIFRTHLSHRINFEAIAIYNSKLYWFVEEELNVNLPSYGSHRMEMNYLYCMKKCDIVVDQDSDSNIEKYDFLMDIDINSDSVVELIIYSNDKTSLYWVKKYVPFISGFGWNSDFWIYIILYIYILSSIVGIFEFYKLKKLNDELTQNNLVKNELQSRDQELR